MRVKEFLKGLEQAKRYAGQHKYRLAARHLTNLLTHRLENIGNNELTAVLSYLAMCYSFSGEHAKAAAIYYKAIEYSVTLAQQRGYYSNYLFVNHYVKQTVAELQEKHFYYQHFLESIIPFEHDLGRHQHKKLRIGYLSTDFYSHIVTNFSIQFFAGYHRSQFEVYCYGWQQIEDVTTEQIKSLIDKWTNIYGLEKKKAAQLIFDDEIDILFDLSGHTSLGETLPIMAYKPAPVQLCGIGWFNTTGVKAVDYFLTDVYCSPIGLCDEQFTERLLRLPHSHFCYTPNRHVLECKGTYQLHSPVVFGSFNNFSKISDDVLSVWYRIIQKVPDSKLILKNSQENRDDMHRDVWQRARQIGFSTENLELRKATNGPLEEYLDIDIALDPFPYGGGGTTCDALYYGVPVIVLQGERHGSRFGVSFLSNLGLTELIGTDENDYINKAIALANDPELIIILHQNLRSIMQKSPLMNSALYIDDMENAYREIWQKWLSERGFFNN